MRPIVVILGPQNVNVCPQSNRAESLRNELKDYLFCLKLSIKVSLLSEQYFKLFEAALLLEVVK